MKRGISLVSLMVTMVIMIMLISSVTISGISTLNNNKKVTFATEISMIQGAVDTYRTQNIGEFPIEAELKLDVTDVSSKSKTQFASEIIDANNLVTLYKINYTALGITSLKYGIGNEEDADIYVVSKDTGKVYYAKGLAIGSLTYYTLTDDLKNIIDSRADSGATNGIIFNVSETDWTSNNVVTTIKVPNTYTNVTVSVLASNNSYFPVEESSYNVYTIDDITSNYIISVAYTRDGKDFTTEYTIDNVDTEHPNITAENIKENILQNGEDIEVYLSLNNYSDRLSGIKVIKYAYLNMTDANEVSSYFKDNGLKVYNDVIEIEEVQKNLTIYIEDNVGNFTAIPYTLSDDAYAKLLERDYVPDVNPTEMVNGITYTAYIPKGFYYVGGDVTTGVVISDSIQDRNKGTSFEVAATLKGNQFVWVPVNYIMATQTLKPGVTSFINLRTGWGVTSEKSTIETLDIDYSEPYTDAEAWEDLEYADMVKSISKYGGFYVARYEAGDANVQQDRTNTTEAHTVVSKQGAHIYNFVPWNSTTANMTSIGDDSGAVQLSHNMYKGSDSVVSHLIYGTQWDVIMYWATIEGKNVSYSSDWGNFSDSFGDASTNSGSLQVAGKNASWQSNNIYDLAGNAFEWTMEAYQTTQRVTRSGKCTKTAPASYRSPLSTTDVWTNYTFRVALYLK